MLITAAFLLLLSHHTHQPPADPIDCKWQPPETQCSVIPVCDVDGVCSFIIVCGVVDPCQPKL